MSSIYDFGVAPAGVAELFNMSAAGPDSTDIFGPPSEVLDIYADGIPIASSEQSLAQGGGATGPFWARHDFHALVMLAVGAFLIHQYAES